MGYPRYVGPMPQIGYGTWQREGDAAYDCVMVALEVGYRHIDTAEGYRNEQFVGKAIADSGVPRCQVFITTKVAPESYAPGQVMGHVKTSLDKLRTDRVDLLLLHWPSINDRYDIRDYMAQFAEVYDAGLASHIGVSNFTRHYLDRAVDLLDGRPIVTNQCEIHVFLQNRVIVDYSAAKGIPMTAYCPLARGAVSGSETLRSIGEMHGASPEQIALAFLMAEGHVVIPSSGDAGRIASNFAARDIVLGTAEIATIRAMEEGRRLIDGDWCPKWDV